VSLAGGAISDGLVGYYDGEFNENHPGANDPDALSNTGVEVGVSGGKFGNAFEFDNTEGDRLQALLSYGTEGTDLGTDFTIAAWFNLDTDAPSGNDGNRHFMWEDAGDYEFSAWVVNDGTIQSYLGGTATEGTHTKGTWQHIAQTITYNAVSDQVTLATYINGVLGSTGTRTATDTGFDDIAINFGRARDSASDRPFDGKMDDIAAWSRVLTVDEITAIASEEIDALLGSGTNQFRITLSSSDAQAGTVSGAGRYYAGTDVTIQASANAGYLFAEWTGDFSGQLASFTYTNDANVTSVAVFAQDTGDTDNDGLTNYEEGAVYGTLPDDPDTDGDGLSDGVEVNRALTDPLTDDSALVDFAASKLYPDSGPAIALDLRAIGRNANSNTVELTIGFPATVDGASWSPTLLDTSPAAITIDGDTLEVTLPAPTNTVTGYYMLGGAPR